MNRLYLSKTMDPEARRQQLRRLDKKRREAQGKESSESNARRDGLAKSKERPPRPNLTVSPRHSPVAEQVKVH